MRMRPKNLDEVVGQQHNYRKDKLLYRAIKADKISFADFLWSSWNRKDNISKSNREYDRVQILCR